MVIQQGVLMVKDINHIAKINNKVHKGTMVYIGTENEKER